MTEELCENCGAFMEGDKCPKCGWEKPLDPNARTDSTQHPGGEAMTEIEINLIEPNPYQTRSYFDETKLRELADSIKTVGLLNRIMVRPHPEKQGHYQLIHGERRLRACKLLELTTIQAEIKNIDDRQVVEITLIENVQREDLNPIEEAQGFKIAIDKLGYTQKELGEKIGKHPTHVTNRLALLELPDEIQEKLRRLNITPGHAQSLVKYYRELKRADAHNIVPTTQDFYAAKVSRGNAKLLSVSRKPETALRYVVNKIEKEGVTVKNLRTAVNNVEAVIDYSIQKKSRLDNEFKKLKNWGLEKYIPAIKNEEIWIIGDRLKFVSITKKYTDQDTPFPKYSGQTNEKWNEETSIPIFTKEEWIDLEIYDIFRDDIWGKEFLGFITPYEPNQIKETHLIRRTYDPSYGDFIVEESEYENSRIPCPYFVKKGWGEWLVLTFNDGNGDRVKRRFFIHDFLGHTVIEEITKTAHPEWFSATNYRRLKLHNAQKYQASWFYFKKEVIKRKDIIEALKADIEQLENAKPLTDEEIRVKVIEELGRYPENLVRAEGTFGFRQGRITTKRDEIGAIDSAYYNEIYPNTIVEAV